jgi:hypothetical protein
MPPERDDALSRALDRLYGGPLEEFVATRKALAKELTGQAHAEGARALQSAAKPTRTAWALNQVARHKPSLVRELLDARTAAVTAQKSGSAEDVRTATREYRARVAVVVREVRGLLEEAGAQASATQLRRVGETLQAAAGDDETRALLVAGRLVRDVDVEDPFAALVAGPGTGARPRGAEATAAPTATTATAGTATATAATAAAAREEARLRAAERERTRRQAAREAATARVAELEEATREARAAARSAETAAARAQDEAQRARREAEQAEARLQKAREELRTLRD